MFSIILLLAGLVVHFNPDWFNGASAVGLVAAIIGGFFLILQLVMLLFVGGVAASQTKTLKGRW